MEDYKSQILIYEFLSSFIPWALALIAGIMLMKLSLSRELKSDQINSYLARTSVLCFLGCIAYLPWVHWLKVLAMPDVFVALNYK